MNDNETEGRGRSAQKRVAKTIEILAQRLVDLPDSEFRKLPRDPELTKEIELTRNTFGHSSRKRQIKHLAGLLRRDDVKRCKFEQALDSQMVNQRQKALAFHHLEELRDRLCETKTFDEAMATVRSIYPLIDDSKITRLAGSVHKHGDKRASREIFRRLRQAAEASEHIELSPPSDLQDPNL
jgi:ribosome-associated protein